MDDHSTSIEKLGEVVRAARLEQDLTVREVADRVGVHYSSITRLEQGAFARPTPHLVKGLARALSLPLSDLYHLAGLTLPEDLPDIGVYLRARHGLPSQAVEELTGYFEFVRAKYGLDPSGPAPGEDEAEDVDKAA